MNRNDHIATWKLILLAGLAGGATEILWVMLYSTITATSGTTIARQVTASLWPVAAEWSLAPALGIAIHLALSLALATVLVSFLLRFAAQRLAPGMVIACAAAMLALVWAVNFFVVLPTLNPGFVTIMPYAATLFSKILFGIAMAWVIRKKTSFVPQRSTSS